MLKALKRKKGKRKKEKRSPAEIPRMQRSQKSAGSELPKQSEEFPIKQALMNSWRPRSGATPQGLVGKHTGSARNGKFLIKKTKPKKTTTKKL